MSEIEKAIKVFEIASENPKRRECIKFDYYHIIKPAFDTALAALHTVREHEKGCCSCDGGWGDNTMEFDESHYKYCPYCGRKLKPQEAT